MSSASRQPLAAFPLVAGMLLLVAPPVVLRPPIALDRALLAGAALGIALFVVLSGRARVVRGVSPRLLGAAILVGASEEVIWRAFVLVQLAARLGVAVALPVSAVAFAATHYTAQGIRGVLVHTGTGLAFGALFVSTGSLPATITAHVLYNVLAIGARNPAVAAPLGERHHAVVEVAGVAKRFGRVEALLAVDLVVGEGEIVALLGPNGAGKTTLVSILLGLRRPDAGAVRIVGDEPDSRRARAQIAATPQEMSFPPTLKVREIVDFVLAHHRKHPPRNAVLDGFGLAEIAGRQTGGISPGQRRRLAVAIAFAANPRVAILDEPTAGLDVESRLRVWDEIRAYAAGGGTVLITTHHLEEAEALAHRVVILSRGQIVGEGTPAGLAQRHSSLQNAYLRLTEGAR